MGEKVKHEKPKLSKKEVDNIIRDILVNDGPDGHCDGADIITDFIFALFSMKEGEWIERYFSNKDKRRLFSAPSK